MLTLLPAENWDYKFRDLVRGLSAAFGPMRSDNLNAKLQISGFGQGIPARSGRAAIVAAIDALNLPPDSKVGVPLYNCPVVFNAVKAAGCTPFFIDVDRDTFCMSAADLVAKISELDAVIAVHMFGNPCDIPKLIEIAEDIPIIEDCAQSIGSKHNGSITGSFGTIAIFSFRSGKYLSVGEGGALFTGQAEMLSRISTAISRMPSPSRKEECVHSIKTYIRSMLRSRPLWGMIGQRLWNIYNTKVEYSAKTTIVLSQIYKSDLANVNHHLEHIESQISMQRANAEYYSQNLELDSAMLCHEKPDTYYNRYLYPIVFNSTEDRDFMAEYLFTRKVGTIKPYQDIVNIAAEHYGYKGGCPVTEHVSKRLLVVPSYYSLLRGEVEHITRYLNAGWKEIRNRANGKVSSNKPY